jgi:hypothetical protein
MCLKDPKGVPLIENNIDKYISNWKPLQRFTNVTTIILDNMSILCLFDIIQFCMIKTLFSR